MSHNHGDDDDEMTLDDWWALTTESNEKAVRANALQHIARVLRGTGKAPEALPVSQTAADLFKELKDEPEYAQELWFYGSLLNELERYQEAIEPLTFCIEYFESQVQESMAGYCLRELANSYRKLDRETDARKALESAVDLLENCEEWTPAGIAALELGEVCGSMGEQTDALTAFQRAYRCFQNSEDLVGSCRAHDRMAAALIDLGQRPNAITHLREAVILADYVNDAWRSTYSRYRLGWTLVSEGLNDEAIPLLMRASSENKARNAYVNSARADMQLAHAYSNTGRYDEALELYRSIRVVFAGSGHMDEAYQTDVNIGIALSNVGNLYEAERLFYKALKGAEELKDEWLERSTKTRIADVCITNEQYARALDVLEGVELDSWGEVMEDIARHLSLLARAKAGLGHLDEAGDYATRILDMVNVHGIETYKASAYVTMSIVMAERDPDASQQLLANAIALHLASGEIELASSLSRSLIPADAVNPKLAAFRAQEQPALFGEEAENA